MANGTAHLIGSTLVVTTIAALFDYRRHGELTWRTPAAGLSALVVAKLPDVLEPADNSHHRQFFHSYSCAALVGYGMKKICEWRPETSEGQVLKENLLAACGSYLTHLSMDALTPRGLPMVGKL